MGSSSSSHWKPPTELYVVLDYKYCKVWVRKSDRVQHMEEYRVHIHNQEQLAKYQHMFTLRIQQQYFPATMYFMNQDSQLMCGPAKMGSILIQRIPYRLCQFTRMLYNQAISIIFHCFQAYMLLYKSYGLFKIQTTMIGVDRFYKIKVWHHTDLSSPTPQDQYCHTLAQMISSIVNCIQRVADRPESRPTFSQFLNSRRTVLLSFQLSFVMIKQYCEIFGYKILNKFDGMQKHQREAEGNLFITKNVFNMKLMDNSRRSQKRSLSSSNKSLGKYSFKKNKIIDCDDQSEKQDLSSIYYHKKSSNSISKPNSVRSILSKQSHSQSKASSPLTKMIVNVSDSQTKKASINNIDEYGMTNKIIKPTFQKHVRAATKFEQVIRQNSRTKDSSHILPYTHHRVVSEMARATSPQNTYNTVTSPYYQNTKTGAGSTSARTKSMISIDEDNRQNVINMLKYK